MTALCITLIFTAIAAVGITTLFAYRKGICDGRRLQAVREYFPKEIKERRKRGVI